MNWGASRGGRYGIVEWRKRKKLCFEEKTDREVSVFFITRCILISICNKECVFI